ncbi:DUF885 domain-containing protein [Seonamhaeicola sediminis]|uniref:DUF885 domain-containing protein n=1 Tax=Seonamhaeicola sediminis TaxID=2528206 RepID=A0A562YGW2_9FLAO|nr:DUF885 family protein [Seonamhaeicola sediminis]TWO34060.1 DUF885 domain-containing protein [Seonamhaeicola sediminis]
MRTTTVILTLLLMLFFSCQMDNKERSRETKTEHLTSNDYQDLIALFKEWRTFEMPPKLEGAPDYRKATFTQRMSAFDQLRARHTAIDTAGWSIPKKVDWMIVWAEMNGFDFNYRVLKPWERDPAFYKTIWTYKSDVPAHEGPTNHGTLELWTYEFPLSNTERERMLNDLAVIPTLNTQAKTNLTGNSRDLWITGIRDIMEQSEVLEDMKSAAGVRADEDMMSAIEKAQTSTNQLVEWLEAESDKKTGPSGIGKDNYTWYMQNVHLVPLTWEDEVMILKRELARAWSALKLEEHRNRDLPELIAVDSPESYDALANRAAKSLMSFLENENILTVKDYFDPALREHLGTFIPEEKRNFFYITSHYDPRPLFSHFYHWFELARMDNEPNPSEIRKGPLLYNIFDSRNEGTATAVEEMFMDAGLYDNDPRVREIVYIMIAQRAARGLGSLYAHANEMTMEEAGGIHSEYTPRGWMKTEKELLIFEQHLYLRQPGYGTSYITGKYLIEAAMAEYARSEELNGEVFELRDFFDSINRIGCIPVVLTQWEMTGNSDHMIMMK